MRTLPTPPLWLALLNHGCAPDPTPGGTPETEVTHQAEPESESRDASDSIPPLDRTLLDARLEEAIQASTSLMVEASDVGW